MQIVLAVHPDRRQTEQFAGLLRKRVAVELVHAPSAGEGLHELGDRIPDLILTAPLLSPFDEDVLAEYLREMGSAAAHVQTLRIPVLSAPPQSGGGIFSFGKKRHADTVSNGCAPDQFVDEIAQYLHRAAQERSAAAATPATPEPSGLDPVAIETSTSAAGDSLLRESILDDAYRFEPVTHSTTEAWESSPVPRIDDAADSAFPIYRPDHEIVQTELPSAWDTPRVEEITLFANEPSSPVHGRDAREPQPESPRAHESRNAVHTQSESTFPSYRLGEAIEARVSVVTSHPIDETRTRVIHELPPVTSVSSPGSTDTGVVAPDDSHASLVLYPVDADATEDRFVAHPAEDITPLGESLVRQMAAAANSEPVSPSVIKSSDPAALEIPAPAAVPATSPQPVIAQADIEAKPIFDASATPRSDAAAPPRTASFEAALAAIRRAWKTPRPSETSEEGSTLSKAIEDKVTAPALQADTRPQLSGGPTEDNARKGTRVEAAHETDLTEHIETIDTEVYERSAPPTRHDIDAEMTATGTPVLTSTAEPPLKGDKQRKDADERHPTARAKSAKPDALSTDDVRDEWGLFDPEHCGFAALVNKLDEVTDEEDQKRRKTKVRLISWA